MLPNWRVQMTTAMGNMDKTMLCEVCCGKNKRMKVFHQHLSTYHYNKYMASLGESNPMCYFCDVHHPIDNMTRAKVILTTSTLSGVQFIKGWSWDDELPMHVDIESIPGARIPTLRKAWERAYDRNPLPIDTLLVAGLNDVNYFTNLSLNNGVSYADLAEPASEGIMTHIKLLYSTTTDHAEAKQVDNTFAVSTILHAPSMYWHEVDGDVPTPTYLNLKHVVDKTNLKIEEFNLLNGVGAAPKPQGTGERKRGKNIRGYHFSHWREEQKQDMLHLKDPHRVKLMKAMVNYFKMATPRAQQIQSQS